MKVFTMTAWLGLLLTCLILSFGLSTMLSQKIVSPKESLSFLGAVSYISTGLLQKEIEISKSKQSVKVLSLVIVVFGFVMFSFYSATLTSSMTVLEPPIQIKSLADLTKYQFKAYTSKGTIFEQLLKTAKPGTDPDREG